ncbi:autotransporter outer membrane beta-barrel domain-containing protein, partial [Yersinia bercovieri]
TYLKGHNKIDDGKEREFQPYIEINWLHNTNNFGTTMNNVTSAMDGAKNIAEVKVGLEGQISRQLNIWGNIGTQVGDKGYSDSAAMIGVKYNF